MPLLMAFQCDHDPVKIEDGLNQTGLLGRWEIADEIMNDGISDLLPKCCQFFEFNTDENKKDFQGVYTYTDGMGIEYSGLFTADLTNEKIIFVNNEKELFVYGFSVDDSELNLTLTFTQNGIKYLQGWIKIN